MPSRTERLAQSVVILAEAIERLNDRLNRIERRLDELSTNTVHTSGNNE